MNFKQWIERPKGPLRGACAYNIIWYAIEPDLASVFKFMAVRRVPHRAIFREWVRWCAATGYTQPKRSKAA